MSPVRRLNVFEPCQDAVMSPVRRLHMFESYQETTCVKSPVRRRHVL